MLYSLFDSVTETYSPIVTFDNDDAVVQYFASSIAFDLEGKSVITRCPDNFVLCRLGDFDNKIGLISPLSAPVTVKTGRELLFVARQIRMNYNKNLEFVNGKESYDDVGKSFECCSADSVDCGNSN